MKKLIILMLGLILIELLSGFDTNNEKIINYFKGKNISPNIIDFSLGRIKKNWLIRIVYKEQWDEALYLVSVDNSSVSAKPFKIDGHFIVSCRVVELPQISKTIIEIVDSTHMGNGDIYLFDENMNLLLRTHFYDSHFEGYQFADYHNLPRFKDRVYNGEEISRIYEGNKLNIKYNYDGKNGILIFGRCLYLSSLNGKDKTISSSDVSKIYYYDKNLGRWELDGKSSKLEPEPF